MIIGKLQSENALLRRVLREHKADAGLIHSGLSIRGVVHLEDEIGSGGDELRHAVWPAIG